MLFIPALTYGAAETIAIEMGWVDRPTQEEMWGDFEFVPEVKEETASCKFLRESREMFEPPNPPPATQVEVSELRAIQQQMRRERC